MIASVPLPVYHAVHPDVLPRRREQRATLALPAHDRLEVQHESGLPTQVRVTAQHHDHCWIRTRGFPQRTRTAVHAIMIGLAHAVAGHAFILLPRHLHEAAEQGEEQIAEYVSDVVGIQTDGLDPASMYDRACEAGYGGPDPSFLRALIAQDERIPPLGEVSIPHPQLQRLARMVQLLDAYARPTRPERGPERVSISYFTWVHPLALLDPTDNQEDYLAYYHPINESYQHGMETGVEDLEPLATFNTRSRDRRALHFWTARHARIIRTAETIVDALAGFCEERLC